MENKKDRLSVNLEYSEEQTIPLALHEMHMLDFYAYMSKAFLDDKDTAPNKLARYYHCVVGK